MLIISSDGEENLFGYHTETRKAGYLPRAFIKEKLEKKRYSILYVPFHIENVEDNVLEFCFHTLLLWTKTFAM